MQLVVGVVEKIEKLFMNKRRFGFESTFYG
jgi:hypothetical protein